MGRDGLLGAEQRKGGQEEGLVRPSKDNHGSMGTVNGLDGRTQEGEDEALFGNGDAEERTGNGHSGDDGETQDVDNWWEAIEGSGVMEGDAGVAGMDDLELDRRRLQGRKDRMKERGDEDMFKCGECGVEDDLSPEAAAEEE